MALLNTGQTFTVVAGPPAILSLSPSGAKKNTSAIITVTGQNLLGAMFQFANPIPNLTNVPGPINIVSNDGSNVVLTFPTGSAEGQYALSATTGVGVSPVNAASQFVVQPSRPQNIDSTAVSVLNIANNWNAAITLPAGRNSYDAGPVSVLNIGNNWNAAITLPSGRNSYDAGPVSVLNIGNNWNTVITLPAGRNTYDSRPVSVLNTQWNIANYVPGVGHNFAMALPVSVCAPPQCTVNQSMMAISLMAHNSANAQPAMPPASASAKAATAAAKKPAAPHLNPAEELDSVVEGRTLRLTATVDSDELAIVEYEVNGVVIGRTTAPPHQMLFTVPAGVGELYLRVIAELPSARRKVHPLYAYAW